MRHLLTLAFFILVVTNCAADKSVKDLKQIKKQIDTLVLLPIMTEVIVRGQNSDDEIDEENQQKINNQLATKTELLLNKKYELKIVGDEVSFSKNYQDSLYNLFKLLNDKKVELETIESPAWLNNIDNSGRYYLLFSLSSHYTKGISPNEKVMRNGIYLSKLNVAGMTMNIILYDKKEGRILYYKTDHKSDDPRLTDALHRMHLNIMRKIYYK